MKRLVVASIVVGAALACDQPVQPALRGTMVIAFGAQRVQPSPAPAPAASVSRGRHTADQTGDTLAQVSQPQASGQDVGGPDLGVMSQLTSARVQLSGPSPHDTTVTLSASGTTQLRFDGLLVGTYVVKVWGLVADTVDSYGQADGVSINGGQSTTLDLTNSSNTFPWAPLRPTLRPLTSPTPAFSQTVRFSAVKTATGYQLQWSKAADFSGAQSVSVTDTIATFTAADTGRYHLRAKATVPATTNPRWSDTVSVLVAAGAAGGGDAGSPYTVRSGVTGVDTTLTGLNLVQAQVQDWFSLDACREDTLLLETRAAALTPPSPLNTLLRLYRSDGTTLVKANDDQSGSNTDSRIDTVLTADGTYKIQVTEANNTVGNYELHIKLRPGAQNTGTGCTAPAANVTPDTVRFTALGDTARLNAQVNVSGSPPFSWVSRDPGVVTVDGTGKLTAAGNGSTWVVASTGGLSDSAFVGVSQSVSLSQSAVTVTPATVAAASFATFKLVAKDARGNRMPGGQTVVFALAGGTSTGTLGTPVDSGNGAYTVSFRGETVGTADSVGATIDGSAVTSTRPTITVTPGPAKRLAFLVQPGGATAGQNIAPTIQVIARDTFDNQVPSVSGTVTMSIANNPSGGTLFGAVNQTVLSGVASFSDLRIDKAGSNYTLKVKPTAGGVLGLDSAISTQFNITGGAQAKVSFVQEPTNAGANASITPAIQVAIQDALGNTVTGVTNLIKLSILVNPGGSVLSGTDSANAQSGTGIATFSNISLDKIASGYRLLATSSGLNPDTSATFNITAGAPARLSFTQEPSNATAGASITPSIQVTVLDGGGNVASSASDTVTIAILNDAGGGATLAGTKKVVPSSGVATFAGLSINRTGAGYTLRVTSGSLTPDTSAAFNISAGAPYQVAFAQQPGAVSSGAIITPSPTVLIQDAQGNTVTSATNNVTLSILANPPGNGVLSGTKTRAAVAGVATFNDLTIDKAGVNYTLLAVGTGTTVSDTSAQFTVVASATVDPDSSGALVSPATGVRVVNSTPGGSDSTTFRSVITVTVRDPSGNPIQAQTVQLSATGTGNTITQPGANTDANGVATATIRSTTAEVKTLTVTVNPSGTPVVLTAHPTVQFVGDSAAVSASLSTATASPDTAVGDGSQQSVITVTVRDTLNNLLAGRPVQLSAACSGCGGALVQPGATNGSGVTTGAISRNGVGQDTIRVKVNPGQSDSVVLNQRPVVVFQGDTISLSVDSSLVVFAPDSVVADGVTTSTITVTVRDTTTAHNGIPGDTVVIAVSGGGNTVGQPSGVTDGAGVAVGSVKSTESGLKTVTVTVKQGPNARILSSKPQITFIAGAPTGLAFRVQPSTVAAGFAIAPSVQVAVVDANGNTVTDDVRPITVDNGNVGPDSLRGTKTVTAVAGVATFNDLSILTAGDYNLNASASMVSPTTSSLFTVTAAAATQIAFQQQPTNVAAGAAITPAVDVRVMDQYGNTVTTATNAVTLAIAAAPDTGAVLSGTTTRTAVAGVASFNNLSLNKVGTGYRLGATATALDGDSSSLFNVTPAPASRLKFTVQPSNGTAAVVIAPSIVVTVQDAFGNTVTGDADSVDLSIADDPSGGAAVLSGTTRQNAVAGVATFNDLSINKSGLNYSLKATRAGLTQDFSLHFNIAAGPATHLAFTVQPAVATAGVAISPAVRVTARDANDNTATTFTDSVTVAIGNDPSGSATLSGTAKRAAVAGVATFNNLSIDKIGSGFTLTADASGLTRTTSNPFNITVAPARRVGFIQQPGTTVAGTYVSPSIQVAVQDTFGNLVPSGTNAVTLAILDNPAGGALLGQTTVSAVSGVATFDSITVDKRSDGYTLLATATSLISDTSAAFTITAGAPNASTSSVTANPTSGIFADSVQASAITVVVRDSFANPVPGRAVTLASSGSGNVLTQPAGNTDTSGTTAGTLAAYVAETKTITATVDGSLALNQQPTVAFVADTGVSATQSLVSVSPDTVLADGSATSTVTVTIKDRFGNLLPGKTATIALSGTGNFITQPGAPSDGGGVTTGTVASIKSGTKTVSVTVDGKTLLQQPTVVFVPGLPAQLGFVVQPTTAASYTSISAPVQVAIQDAHGNTVDTASTSISLTLTDGTPNSHIYGTFPVATVSGVATFPDVRVDSAGVGYRLQAGNGILTAGVSDTFRIVPGAVYTIAVTSNRGDTLYVLGDTLRASAVARDSAGNLIPDAVFAWSSTPVSVPQPVLLVGAERVMTVDPSTGLVTAVGRGRADVTATAGARTGTAHLAVGIRLAGIGNSFGSPPTQLFSSGDQVGTFTQLSPAAFNAIATAADLRAQYDALLFGSASDGSVNAAWTGRLRDYLQLGGGLVFEDPANIGELSSVLTGAAHDTSGGIVKLDVTPAFPPFIGSDFAASHITFSAWSDSLAPFLAQGDSVLGVYGRFGNGCLAATGTAQATDGFRAGTSTQHNQYLLFMYEVRLAADCPLNASPGPAVAVRVFPKSRAFTNVSQSTTLRATALDSMGTPIPNHAIAWSAVNDTIATVNPSTGEVTSAHDGQVAIRAEGSGVDYALMTVGVPAGTELNAWGTEAAPGTLFNSYFAASWGTSTSNYYVAGDLGAIRHYNGVTWDTVPSPTSQWLWGAWGSSANDVYFVGGAGAVVHYSGSSWDLISIGGADGSAYFYDVWGSAPNDVFIVGTGGVIQHWDGQQWQSMPNPQYGVSDLYGVWGTSARNVWAVGYNIIEHYDGATWTAVTNPLPSQQLFRVWGSSANDVFVVGISGSDFAHFDGTSWSTQTNPVPGYPFYGLWGTSSTEVYAAGYQSIVKYNGSTWSKMDTPTPDYVLTLWGTSDGQFRAAGASGQVWHGIRGASPSRVQVAPAGATVNGLGGNQQYAARPFDASNNVITTSEVPVWAATNTDVASVSGSGLASVARDGQTPLSATVSSITGYANLTGLNPGAIGVTVHDSAANPAGPSWLWSVWGTSASNVFAMGYSAIDRYNGSSWSAATIPGGVSDVRSMWGASDTSLWAVTGGGYILHSTDGGTWTTAASGLGGLYGVWGSAPNDIWAVGSGGAILHYDGGSWSTDTTTGTFLWSVWGWSRDLAFAVGSSGRILQWNGTSWIPMTPPAGKETTTFYRVWGTGPSNVFAVGSGGTIIRFNGSSWATMTSNTASELYAIWGAGTSDIYAVGSGGTIVRFNGATWNPQASATTQDIYGVWGTGGDFVWGGQNAGLIRRGVRGAPAVNYGESFTLSTNVSWAANYLIGIPITVSSKTDVTSLGTILKGVGGNLNLALYTDASGSPGNLIVQTGPFIGSGAGVYNRPVAQRTLQPGQYWILQISDFSGTPTGAEVSGGPGYRYVSWTYTTGFPAAAPAMGAAGTYRLNYYISGFTVP